MRRNGNISFQGILIAVVVAVLILFFVVMALGTFHQLDASNCVVTGKDRTTDKEGESDMRVYTENCGVFKVKDSLVHSSFRSSETYGSIRDGATYNFEAYGYRIPILSQFPNVVKATEVK